MKRKMMVTAIALLIVMAFNSVAFAAGSRTAQAYVMTSGSRNPAYSSAIIVISGEYATLSGSNDGGSEGALTAKLNKNGSVVTSFTVQSGGSKSATYRTLSGGDSLVAIASLNVSAPSYGFGTATVTTRS